MVKLFIKLNDSDLSFTITAKEGREVLKTVKGYYRKDLADKLIKGLAHSMNSVQVLSAKSKSKSVEGLDKISCCAKIKKRDKFKAYYDSQSKSFVSNLITNSVVSVFNWLGKNLTPR